MANTNSWDVYCFLTGARFLNSIEEVRDDIIRRIGADAGIRLSKNVKKGLTYSKEDVEFSEKYVMICHYERSVKGGITPLARFNAPEPTIYNTETITEVFNVMPGVFPDHGEYLNDDPTDDDGGLYRVHPRATPAFLITHGAYLILKQAAPSLEPHDLYRIYRTKNTNAVDYGPVNGITGERYVFWPGLCSEKRSPSPNDVLKLWRGLLSQKGKCDEEILHDAWKGRGNLWALIRPDRFPIQETSIGTPTCIHRSILPQDCTSILSLPLEIHLLICEHLHPYFIQCFISTCRTMFWRLSGEVDHVVHQYIQQCEPWYLPAGPFDFPNGTQEVDLWNSQWAEMGISGPRLQNKIPWLKYRRAASHSMSMWNRIRIWRVAQQLESWAA